MSPPGGSLFDEPEHGASAPKRRATSQSNSPTLSRERWCFGSPRTMSTRDGRRWRCH